MAIEYFTVVKKFPLIWTAANYSYPDEIDAKTKRANMTIRVLNIVFYTLVLTCFIVGEYYYLNLHSVPDSLRTAWLFFDAILKLMSGFLIVYSLLLFKGFVKKMRQSNADFFTSEGLMTVHFAVFVLFIIANFGTCIRNSISLVRYNDWNNKYEENDASSFCRDKITDAFFSGLTIFTNVLMLFLFTYLSVKFSEPLQDYRSNFLMLF